MRIPSQLHSLALAAGLLLASVASPAHAGSFYRWETEDGGIAFTDDAKRIPARYQDQAEAIGQPSLQDFERFTPMAPSQPAPYAARIGERLETLRAFNAGTAPSVAAAPPGGRSGLAVRSGRDGQDVEAYVDPREGGEPIVVETVRSRPAGSPVTRHVTIVRQGDEVLSVIAPVQRHSGARSTVDERDLFE